jgi:uncharacterized phiE125 gp8 family phage protein
MWYPATATAAPTSLPVSVAEAMAHCRVEGEDNDPEIATLAIYLASAVAHVENYTGLKLVTQTIAAKCDSFDDMARLPFAPVNTVVSIVYIDTNGATATLDTTVYELRADGLETSIELKPNQTWPARQAGTRIVTTMTVGGTETADPIRHAILILTSEAFERREPVAVGGMTTVDALLVNYRIYA